MIISKEKLYFEAESTGFRPEVLEKVIHLLALLEGFRDHPFLKGRLVLKGGTALNLFAFDLPRLSVDIDLNFMFRIPLWPIVAQNSRPVGSYKAIKISVLDIHELAAGKLVALLVRQGSRDLFDVYQLLNSGSLDRERLRLAFVVYGAINRKDWRTVSNRDMNFEANEFQNNLLPLLRRNFLTGIDQNTAWATRLVEECRQALGAVLPLSEGEIKFLTRLLDDGEIEPSLLTVDTALAQRIEHHPALQWKALNVREHKVK
jgi:predicted nucleotidyltransferase component of viral defense system